MTCLVIGTEFKGVLLGCHFGAFIETNHFSLRGQFQETTKNFQNSDSKCVKETWTLFVQEF